MIDIYRLAKISEHYNEGFTHFFVNTEIIFSKINENARITKETINSGTLIAVIGGVLIDEHDHYIAMPMGTGVFLHQVNNAHKGTVNHSCEPNCKIEGFNKLVAKRDININEELTIDYGTVSIGKGTTIISECNCGSMSCRHTIKSDDYKLLPVEDLCVFGKYIKENIK
jgi:hypothetical protein